MHIVNHKVCLTLEYDLKNLVKYFLEMQGNLLHLKRQGNSRDPSRLLPTATIQMFILNLW